MSAITFSWEEYVRTYPSKAKSQFKSFLFEFYNERIRWTRSNGEYFDTCTLGRVLMNIHNNAYHYILDTDTMDYTELAIALADYICGPNFDSQQTYIASFYEMLSKNNVFYEHPRSGRISAKELPQFIHFKQYCFAWSPRQQTQHPIAT